MSIKEKSDFMQGQTLFEVSGQKQTDVNETKSQMFHQTTPSSPTNGKPLRGFVKICRDNCLLQNDVKHLETVSSYTGMS